MNRNLIPSARSVALLLDPDKADEARLDRMIKIAAGNKVDFILAGGSITFNIIDPLISAIKASCNIPVILFPGNLLQLSTKADGVYFLSLISGRNPELLIGNHVLAAPFLKNIKERVIPVGYMLINGGKKSSVEYLSQTEAIPPDKHDIITATALAGEMLGMKMIYLEAGSGADLPVPPEVIREVKMNISVPVVVGGGITSPSQIREAFRAGADMIVLGNGCEKEPSLLEEACKIRNSLS
ncbi:MAG TPA: geranylgeranylglyceryl/heptaprenylglyceryl phosphate synthase [Bacteroidales bacterium]|nr:geranylgeranylglyceryl/heptaprenylglyceryl phosphate synthase [Bacteroidales bacterium]